jgi:hypothetical protein
MTTTDLASLPLAVRRLPLLFVVGITVGLGVWQLQRQGGKVHKEDFPWTFAGGWGVLSAMGGAYKLDWPYRCVLTLPMSLARKLQAVDSFLVVVCVLALLYCGMWAGLAVLFMRLCA